MSKIYFHARDCEAEVSGSERFFMGGMLDALAFSTLDHSDLKKRIKFTKDHYIKNKIESESDLSPAEKQSLQNAIQFGTDGAILLWDELTKNYQSPFTWQLNQAWRLGSDPVRLCARIHGQCEIHAWIQKDNYSWMATIIRMALKYKILREEIRGAPLGWDNVLKLLKDTKSEYVVLSYSVTNSFPDGDLLDMGDEFYDLSADEQWDKCIVELTKNKGLEITPACWDEFHYGEMGDA